MMIIENRRFGEERALYESRGLTVRNCRFEGAEDGESALKESTEIIAENCFFALRYPFWHDKELKIIGCEMTETCRAALWYTTRAEITDTKMHGIKALRECENITVRDCDIDSPEFGWSVKNITMENTSAVSEYFMMRSEDLTFRGVKLTGKYSFQYIRDSVFENCVFNTKDSFWHAENVTVRNSEINGEYLAWYSENLTLENCVISGTQPFCYCRGLRLINCEMRGADLAFERSEVQAEITAPVISIKNPLSGTIRVPSIGEIIISDERFKGRVIVGESAAE